MVHQPSYKDDADFIVKSRTKVYANLMDGISNKNYTQRVYARCLDKESEFYNALFGGTFKIYESDPTRVHIEFRQVEFVDGGRASIRAIGIGMDHQYGIPATVKKNTVNKIIKQVVKSATSLLDSGNDITNQLIEEKTDEQTEKLEIDHVVEIGPNTTVIVMFETLQKIKKGY